MGLDDKLSNKAEDLKGQGKEDQASAAVKDAGEKVKDAGKRLKDGLT